MQPQGEPPSNESSISIPSTSILATFTNPSFHPVTHELTTVDHHLLSAPLTYAESFAPCYRAHVRPPPTIPFQSSLSFSEHDTVQSASSHDTTPPDIALTSTNHSARRRKRRKRTTLSEIDYSPLDWLNYRKYNERLSVADIGTREHHKSIDVLLETVIAGLRKERLRSYVGPSCDLWMGRLDKFACFVDEKQEPNWDLAKLTTSSVNIQNSEVLFLSASGLQKPIAFEEIINRIVCNDSTEPQEIALGDDKSQTFVLPSSSAFLLSDFKYWSHPNSGIAELGSRIGGWNVLIIDPPWPNSSAVRSSTYEVFDPYDLWKLDVKAILGKEQGPCLVVVWLTNKVKFRRLLIDQLFPAWGVANSPKDTVAEWYWVKITDQAPEGEHLGGMPVWGIDNVHRRCYEGLVLAYYNPLGSPIPVIPTKKILLSTPIGHSRKPVLLDVIKPYIPRSSGQNPPNVLELFARTTLAGPKSQKSTKEANSTRGLWLSVGNEAIKFNQLQKGSGNVRRGWLSRIED